jgi:hypothetical protein
MADILPILRRKLSNWQIAMWFVAPNAWTGEWHRPIDLLLDHLDLVIAAARHEIGEQAL